MDDPLLGAFLLVLTFGSARKYDAPESSTIQLHEASGTSTSRLGEVLEHGRRVLPRITLEQWRRKKGGKSPSTLPPLKRKGKKFREKAEILI
jgi:hypothetical protein